MLRRELYVGRFIWNRSKFIKKPGSRKRIRRERPQSEWRIKERPDLRIIPDELWRAVQVRLARTGETYGRRGPGKALLGRGVHHLLTGFVKCGECGHNLTIVSGCRKGGHPKYGCPQNSERGVCSNDLREREDWLEERLLADLQREVLKPEVIDFAVEEFGQQLKARFSGLVSRLAGDRERKASLSLNLTDCGVWLPKAARLIPYRGRLPEREQELKAIKGRLLPEGPGSSRAILTQSAHSSTERLADIRALLLRDIPSARAELAKHVKEIRMKPQEMGKARFYVAEGEWNLLGGFGGSFLNGTATNNDRN